MLYGGNPLDAATRTAAGGEVRTWPEAFTTVGIAMAIALVVYRFAVVGNKQKPRIDGPGFLKETKQKQQLPLPVVTMASKRISGERIAPF